MPSPQNTRTAAARPGSPLGGWIRATRSEQGLSQRELASRSGLSRSYVCDIERGRSAHPSVETLDKLASVLGFSRIDLLKASGVVEPVGNQRETDEERRMLSVYRDLSEAGRISVMRFARFVHADEQQWTQPNLLEILDGQASQPEGPHRATRALFEIPAEQGNARNG